MSNIAVDKRTIFVTGASGFVGTALINRLRNDSRFQVRAISRRALSIDGVEALIGQNLGPDATWTNAIRDTDTVVHLAARVHVMRDSTVDPLAEFRNVNTAGTQRLARDAAAAGVRRFIYLSSIKVNGENTDPGRPFRERDDPAPADLYGISKFEAEIALGHIGRQTGMEIVTIRPPLVYGPGVKANFRRMMQWLYRRVPLPFGAIDNRRTLIGLDNLVDLITTCISHPRAGNEVFLAGDGEDLSTSDLLERLGLALGRQARLIPVPAVLLRLALGALGQRDVAQRLCGWLQVDISRARDVLSWDPPVSVDEGLRRVANDFVTRLSQ